MNPDAIKALLLYSLAFNYAILIIWFGVFSLAHDWIYRLHSRWFGLSVEVFDALHYGSMALYKVGVLLLNVAPLAYIICPAETTGNYAINRKVCQPLINAHLTKCWAMMKILLGYGVINTET